MRRDLDGDTTARRLRALARIRKLLRLAEDQKGQPEGDAAMGRARALMDEYGLQQSTLDLGGGVDFRHRAFALGASAAWRRTLVHAISDYFDCVALYESDADQAETYGPDHALPQIEYTYVVYLRQLQRAWKQHTDDMRAADVWQPLSRRQQFDAREAFCVSFVLGVKERLELDRQSERAADPSSWDQSTRSRKDLDRWMRRGGVRWRSNPSGVHSFSNEGYRAGLEAEVRTGLRAADGPRQLANAAVNIKKDSK